MGISEKKVDAAREWVAHGTGQGGKIADEELRRLIERRLIETARELSAVDELAESALPITN